MLETSKLRTYACYLTDLFPMSDPQISLVEVSELHKASRSTDFKALKSGNV